MFFVRALVRHESSAHHSWIFSCSHVASKLLSFRLISSIKRLALFFSVPLYFFVFCSTSQAKEELDTIPRDLQRPWEDPLAEPGDRYLAQELKNIGMAAWQPDAWKQETMGKNISIGKVPRAHETPERHQSETRQIHKTPTHWQIMVANHSVLTIKIRVLTESIFAMFLSGFAWKKCSFSIHL